MQNRIIVIDDEQDFLESVRRGLITAGFRNVVLVSDPRKAGMLFEGGEVFDIALIDITMPFMNGIELLQMIRNTSPSTECLMITAMNEARVAVDCVKRGAYDYLTKPIFREDLILAVRNALERKRLLDILALDKSKTAPKLIHKEAFKPILTRSAKILKVLKEAELHAQSDVPILITGESGTGKELLARAIHMVSPRRKSLFTPVNMASLTPSLFDAEFFGHTRGAFTGAQGNRAGYLEETNRGTLFLDEIGHLSPELQGKFLRVLQDGEFFKLGMSKPQRVDVRFVAATNTDLDRLIVKGAFRKDLYYRLKGAWLHLPPLRDRKEDIPLLIDRFMAEIRGDGHADGVEEETLAALMSYDYPGNIRELRSIVQSAVNLAQGKQLAVRFLPAHLKSGKQHTKMSIPRSDDSMTSLAEVEKGHILMAYDRTEKNKAQTARLLDIGLNTLRRKLATYGVD
jgi:two-component system response regulator AtoC